MQIKVLPKYKFIDVLKSSVIENPDLFFISILDPDCKEPLKEDSDNYKTFWFWDVDKTVGNYEPIKGWQVRELYEFIIRNKGKKGCYVHCSAGVSRSGAIGLFINDLKEQSYSSFMLNNPQVKPNSLISQMLNRIHRKNNS